MAKNKHLQYLRREARSQVKAALPSQMIKTIEANTITIANMTKPIPKFFLLRWIYIAAWSIVMRVPMKSEEYVDAQTHK